MNKKSRYNVLAVLTLLIIVLIGAFYTTYSQNSKIKKSAEVEVVQDKIQIKADFGTSINIKDISDVKLVDDMPAVAFKENGAEIDEYKRGDFDVKSIGKCKMYTDSKSGPFIYIVVGNKYTIINYKDTSKTKNLYEKLKSSF